MSDKPPGNGHSQKEIQQLLAGSQIVVGPCDLDLLLFFYRHPRAFLTSEQLADFVGYDMKQIARSIDRFMEAGLLDRKQNSMHAARQYLLLLEGPQAAKLKTLLELASTRQGRSSILQLLLPVRRGSANAAHQAPEYMDQAQRRLHIVA